MKRASVPQLTGLRFVAAIYVVLYHLRPDHSYTELFHPANIIGAGYTGVTLFFVLSGFILVYNYAPEPAARQSLGRRAFFAARFARIYPLYILGLLVELPRFIQIELASNPPRRLSGSAETVFSSFAMIQAWQPTLAYRLNWPTWSVSAEAFFYLAFPMFLGFACSEPVRRKWVAVLIVLWITSIGIVVGTDALSSAPIIASWYSRYDWFSFLYYFPLLRLPEFLMGMCLGAVFAYDQGPETRRLRSGWTLVAVILALLFILAWSPAFPDILLRTGLLAPLFGLLILLLASSDTVASRMLSTDVLVRLGEASFGMYILHVPIHTALRGIDLYTGSHLYGTWGWAPVYIYSLTGASLMTLEYIEEPARRYLRRKLQRSSIIELGQASEALLPKGTGSSFFRRP